MKRIVPVVVLVALGIAIGVVGYRRVLADRRAAAEGELARSAVR